MRKIYKERAIEKARQEAAEAEAEYKSARFLQNMVYITAVLGILCIALIGIPSLWNWLVNGKSLDGFIAFQLAMSPIAVLMMMWTYQWAESYVLFGQENKSHTQRRFEALQKKYGKQGAGNGGAR
jgi:hypothetical protein